MSNYQIITCPNCGGKGCSTCKNTGKIRIRTDQLQKLKTLLKQKQHIQPQQTQELQLPQIGSQNKFYPTNTGQIKQKANLAGIAAFSVLSIITGGAIASWYFLKSLKPFFLAITALIISVGTFFTWHSPFFRLKQPNDFLSRINS